MCSGENQDRYLRSGVSIYLERMTEIRVEITTIFTCIYIYARMNEMK